MNMTRIRAVMDATWEWGARLVKLVILAGIVYVGYTVWGWISWAF